MDGWFVALLALGALVAFDLLALHFGSDSRDGIASDEWPRRREWWRRWTPGGIAIGPQEPDSLGNAARVALETKMFNGLLAEDIVLAHSAQVERDLAQAHLLREARAARAAAAATRGSIAAAARVALRQAVAGSAGVIGGWLVSTGGWMQALGTRAAPDLNCA